MKYTMLINTIVDGRRCKVGEEIELTDEARISHLLEGGNIAEGSAASPRHDGDPRAAAQEAPATEAPLDEGEQSEEEESKDSSPQPNPSEVAQAADLENESQSSESENPAEPTPVEVQIS